MQRQIAEARRESASRVRAPATIQPTRVTLLQLPRMAEHGAGRRTTDTKNGAPLAGHGAAAVRDAITRAMRTLPVQLRRSLTWDQGSEMAEHAQLRIDTGLAVYFCDLQSP